MSTSQGTQADANLEKVDHIVVLMLENRSVDHMLGYLSLEGMVAAVGGKDWYCHACFSGQYAIPFTPTNKRQMRLVGV